MLVKYLQRHLRMNKTHWLRYDHRLHILELVIEGLQESINQLHSQISKIEWYDSIWFLEEAEPIIGLSCIAYQNYINSSIYDKFENTHDKIEFYKRGSNNIENNRSEIELIIALANYYKHRDETGSLHKGTANVLSDLNLDNFEDPETPIIKGFEILSNSWNFQDVTKKVADWRENLWLNE